MGSVVTCGIELAFFDACAAVFNDFVLGFAIAEGTTQKRAFFCRYFEGNSPAAIRNICLLYQVGNYQNTLSTVEFDDSGFWFICFLSLYVTSSINNINI